MIQVPRMTVGRLAKAIAASFDVFPFKKGSPLLRSLVDPTDSVRRVGHEMFDAIGGSMGATDVSPAEMDATRYVFPWLRDVS